MGSLIDMSGARYGRLTVIRRDGSDSFKRAMWLARCDCGADVRVAGFHLRSGNTRSCGCLSADLSAERGRARTKHGHARTGRLTAEFSTWSSMLARCSANSARRDYVERGVRVCARWRASFSAFLEDMGPRPSPRHSIDRIDNDGDYEPGNCRWATLRTQNGNRRTSVLVTVQGETACVAEWCRRNGIAEATARARIRRGWTPAAAVTTSPGARAEVSR